MANIRVWNELNLEEIKKHLLIIGELKGDCANCRAIGIDYLSQGECPECKTNFKYICVRRASNAVQLLKKIKEKGLQLIVIEYEDFKVTLDRQKAKDFFS